MQAARDIWVAIMCLCAAMLACVGGAVAQTPAGPGPHVATQLLAETPEPAAGGRVTLAISARPQPGWHGYWSNPGDAGLPPTPKWTLPAGVTAGPLRFPVPQTLLIAGLMNHVYEGPYALLVDLAVPAGLVPGTRLPIALTLDYLVCTNEICVPESAKLSTVLTVGNGAVDPATRATFDTWRRTLPRPIGSPAAVAVEGTRVRIAVPYPASAAEPRGAHFFADDNRVLNPAAPQAIVRDGDRLVIEADAAKGAGATALTGVLKVSDGQGFAVQASPGTVPPARSGSGGQSDDLWTALLAFAGAVLGGLVLNVMPCVFPILSLKALSLARAGGEGARREAVAYTAGVVLVCVALGGLLLALRAGGASVGWAFQLTDPRVILVLVVLVSAIALNLAGLFELAAPSAVNRLAAEGSGGAFATGALAAFVATPCTGPFMGAALGTALILPAWGAIAVFAGLGLGLALPFLLLGFVPALRRRLPRPGAWMETFRRILSLPMFLTALALAWVLGRQAGADGLVLGLAAVLVAGVGLWWTGLRQAAGRTGAWAPGTLAFLLAIGTAALVAQAKAPAEAATASLGPAGAERFTEARLAELRAANRPVFAYFTADWCVTCKVNEKAVIETEAVERGLRDAKVAVLVGDWTDGDPALGRFIEQHNRAGVPLYLWYKPGAATPEVLPQILTPAMLSERSRG